jgi:hypothetical protein
MTTRPSGVRRLAGRRYLAGALALALTLTATGTLTGSAASATPARPGTSGPNLGANVTVFQATLDAAYAKQVDNEMGTQRYAFLFKPGTYGTADKPLQVKVGYYTEISGLGASPADVVINGKVEVYNRCLEGGGTSNCLALVNFWRTLSNLSINVNGKGQDGCRAGANFWAVSQAVSLRRLNVNGGFTLMDYCTAGPQYASGGFIADSKFDGVTNGSQQQWLTRNSQLGSWSNGVWNQVFAGVQGAPAEDTFPTAPYTTLEKTPVSREKPYLFTDASGQYSVRVPSAQKNSSGTSWSAGLTAGRTIPLSKFFVAKPSDPVWLINANLALGKNRGQRRHPADGRGRPGRGGRRRDHRRRHQGVEEPAEGRLGARARLQLGGQPDDPVRRVLPRRRPAHRQGRRGARGQQRQRADRPHLGVAR